MLQYGVPSCPTEIWKDLFTVLKTQQFRVTFAFEFAQREADWLTYQSTEDCESNVLQHFCYEDLVPQQLEASDGKPGRGYYAMGISKTTHCCRFGKILAILELNECFCFFWHQVGILT